MMLMLLMFMVVLMVMLMLVAAAGAVFIMFVVVMMLMLLMFMVVLMVMLMAAAGAVLIVLVVVMCGFGGQLGQFGIQCVAVLHSLYDLCAVQLRPRGGDDGGFVIVSAQQLHTGGKSRLAHAVGTAQHDAVGIFDLVVEELAEVLHVHLALVGIGYGGEAVQAHILHVQILHSADHITQFAHAGRLDQNAVGMVGLQHFGKSLAEIAHQTAADAAAVHFGHLNAGILQKTAVNADLTEFVFDEHQLFTGKGLFDQLFDQRGLACAQKTGKNIDLGHNTFISFLKNAHKGILFQQNIIHPNAKKNKP